MLALLVLGPHVEKERCLKSASLARRPVVWVQTGIPNSPSYPLGCILVLFCVFTKMSKAFGLDPQQVGCESPFVSALLSRSLMLSGMQEAGFMTEKFVQALGGVCLWFCGSEHEK